MQSLQTGKSAGLAKSTGRMARMVSGRYMEVRADPAHGLMNPPVVLFRWFYRPQLAVVAAILSGACARAVTARLL